MFLCFKLSEGLLSHPGSSVAVMESRTGSVESIDAAGAGCVACAAGVEVAALSDGELVERMTQLGRGRSRMDAMLAETAAEMQRRSGGRATAAMMRERLHVSSLQATADTALAASLADEYPSTLEAWRAGEITAGHARVIARVGADPDHADEPSLLEMARGYPVDMFARMTRQYMSSQDSAEEHQRQHQNGTPAPASGSSWRPATAAASTARPPPRGVRPTTSNGSSGADPPTSTSLIMLGPCWRGGSDSIDNGHSALIRICRSVSVAGRGTGRSGGRDLIGALIPAP